MKNDITIRDLFKEWCARNGYTPRRAIDVYCDPGDAALNTRHGWWTITIFKSYDEDNMTCHKDCPLEKVTEERAREFLTS